MSFSSVRRRTPQQYTVAIVKIPHQLEHNIYSS